MGLAVLIVEGADPVTEALARTLARRGHRVATAPCAEQALELPLPDVFVCEARLPGADGLDLLRTLEQRGERARVVLLLGQPTVEECLRAVQLGATDLLAKPFRLADLVRAVEGRGRTAPLPAPETSRTFDRPYPARPASLRRCALDLSAFALAHGLCPSARARIAGAAGEILENAILHAGLRAGGSVRVRAEIEGERLCLRIRDTGAGFDPERACRTVRRGPATTGLARAAALSESFRLQTAIGAGTEVELRFSLARSALSVACRDLSESEYLEPGEARTLLADLLRGSTPEVEGISPAVAVVLGRLLAGPDMGYAAPRPRHPGPALP